MPSLVQMLEYFAADGGVAATSVTRSTTFLSGKTRDRAGGSG